MKPSFGDTVILKFSKDHKEVHLVQGDKVMNRFGVFLHDEIINVDYGARVYCKDRYAILLKFTPLLWSKSLSNRTQIIYPCDSSLILSKCNIVPGSVVIESGTGSGCLSHSFLNALLPTGHLYTFEYNENRYKEAELEFARHNLSTNTTCQHRDVCKEGFNLHNIADVVFLDLPSPWECIAFAKETLKKDKLTTICIFSPCIEQIQKSCLELASNGFSSIRMYECLLYDHYLRQIPLLNIDTNEQLEESVIGRYTEQKSHTSFLLYAELEVQ